MRDIIEGALRGHNADYIDLRIDDGTATRITYRGRDLDEITRTHTGYGGCVRALYKGGWGFASFNDLNGLRERVATAVEQARVASIGERSEFAGVEPAVATVARQVGDDPNAVSLADKKGLLDQYNEIIWGIDGIATSSLRYGDSHRTITFASTDGSYIEQARTDVIFGLSVMARKDGDVQQAGFSKGGLNDFSFVRGKHDEVRETAQRAVAFLDAPKVEGGEYTVVLDPVLAGVFVHEAFGHLSESDHIYEDDRLKEIMTLGRRFGGRHINITDGAAVPALRGSYAYDDEGTPAQRTALIREGVLVGRLHSRETAAKMGEQPTGNARAITYQFPPIVRMTNTFIEPGETSFDDMLADVKDGLYVKNWYGGTTSMEMFTFSAGETYRIRDGKVAELMRPIVLTGNLFTTMENLDAIGDDLDMNQGGGCGKAGQMPLPVSTGSPHIRIQKCLIGSTA